jgi:hypothetical protein
MIDKNPVNSKQRKKFKATYEWYLEMLIDAKRTHESWLRYVIPLSAEGSGTQAANGNRYCLIVVNVCMFIPSDIQLFS